MENVVFSIHVTLIWEFWNIHETWIWEFWGSMPLNLESAKKPALPLGLKGSLKKTKFQNENECKGKTSECEKHENTKVKVKKKMRPPSEREFLEQEYS